MRKRLCVVVFGLLLTLAGGLAYSQEREPAPPAPRAPQGRPFMANPMPGGPMAGGMGPKRVAVMLQLIRDNPTVAGLMMQMHGEMMRIRGEEMSKMGDVMSDTASALKKRVANRACILLLSI